MLIPCVVIWVGISCFLSLVGGLASLFALYTPDTSWTTKYTLYEYLTTVGYAFALFMSVIGILFLGWEEGDRSDPFPFVFSGVGVVILVLLIVGKFFWPIVVGPDFGIYILVGVGCLVLGTLLGFGMRKFPYRRRQSA